MIGLKTSCHFLIQSKVKFLVCLVFFFQAQHGYTNLVGVDYSEEAVQLASAIAAEEQVNIKYQVCLKAL